MRHCESRGKAVWHRSDRRQLTLLHVTLCSV